MITVRSWDETREYQFDSFQLKPYFEEEKNKNIKNDQDNYCKKSFTGMTEVITKGDPRENCFEDAKRKELTALADRETWDILFKRDVPKNAIILGERFVLEIKTEGTRNKVWEARCFVQRYRGKLETSLEYNSATVQHFFSVYPLRCHLR